MESTSGIEIEEEDDIRSKLRSKKSLRVLDLRDADDTAYYSSRESDQGKQGILTKKILTNGLSKVGRALENHQYAFIDLDLSNLNLENIDLIESYIHLRIIDLSWNKLVDENLQPLKSITYLEVLNLEGNLIQRVSSVPHLNLKYLKILNLSKNPINSTARFEPNGISYLQLSDNSIEKIENINDGIFPQIITLDIHWNGLTSLGDLKSSTLNNLFIAGNSISDFKGIENCPEITYLHARQNKITNLHNFPPLVKLDYLNLMNNEIKSLDDIRDLQNCPNLKTLILTGNPIESNENFRDEIGALLPNLERLNKQKMHPEAGDTELENNEDAKDRNARSENDVNDVILSRILAASHQMTDKPYMGSGVCQESSIGFKGLSKEQVYSRFSEMSLSNLPEFAEKVDEKVRQIFGNQQGDGNKVLQYTFRDDKKCLVQVVEQPEPTEPESVSPEPMIMDQQFEDLEENDDGFDYSLLKSKKSLRVLDLHTPDDKWDSDDKIDESNEGNEDNDETIDKESADEVEE